MTSNQKSHSVVETVEACALKPSLSPPVNQVHHADFIDTLMESFIYSTRIKIHTLSTTGWCDDQKIDFYIILKKLKLRSKEQPLSCVYLEEVKVQDVLLLQVENERATRLRRSRFGA